MTEWLVDNLYAAASAIVDALRALVIPFCAFFLLGVFLRRGKILLDMRRLAPESATNLGILLFNVVVITPILAGMAIALEQLLGGTPFTSALRNAWSGVPNFVVIAAAVFVGDFAGYWRHRIEHTKILWPSHAIHHSDTQMTWLTLERMHPINRLSTFALDSAFLILLGFPAYAVIANNLVRHYYGYFIHADLPWTYGPLDKVFVSPAMHRWHHAMDAKAYNSNFATVFSIFDRFFGTLYLPGPCKASLGVNFDMGKGLVGQLSYPFRPGAYAGLLSPDRTTAPRRAETSNRVDPA